MLQININLLSFIIIFAICFLVYQKMVIYYEHPHQFQIIYTKYINKNNILQQCSNKIPVVFKSPKKIISNMFLPNLTGDWKTFSSNDFFATQQAFPFYLSSSTIIPYSSTDNIFTQDNFEKLPFYFCNQFDELLKSPYYLHSCYDVCFGFKNSIIPLQHNTMYKKFVYVASGGCSVRLTNWKSTFFIKNQMHCFSTLPTYYSNVNVWSRKNELENVVEFKTVQLDVGNFLFIPPYWWNSIYFDKDTVLIIIYYDTIGNKIAHIGEWLQSYRMNWTTSNIANNTEENITSKEENITNKNSFANDKELDLDLEFIKMPNVKKNKIHQTEMQKETEPEPEPIIANNNLQFNEDDAIDIEIDDNIENINL